MEVKGMHSLGIKPTGFSCQCSTTELHSYDHQTTTTNMFYLTFCSYSSWSKHGIHWINVHVIRTASNDSCGRGLGTRLVRITETFRYSVHVSQEHIRTDG